MTYLVTYVIPHLLPPSKKLKIYFFAQPPNGITFIENVYGYLDTDVSNTLSIHEKLLLWKNNISIFSMCLLRLFETLFYTVMKYVSLCCIKRGF